MIRRLLHTLYLCCLVTALPITPGPVAQLSGQEVSASADRISIAAGRLTGELELDGLLSDPQ